MPILSEDALRKAVEKLPPDHSLALVGTVDAKGARVAVVMKKEGSHWELRGAYEHDWSGDNRVSATILFSR